MKIKIIYINIQENRLTDGRLLRPPGDARTPFLHWSGATHECVFGLHGVDCLGGGGGGGVLTTGGGGGRAVCGGKYSLVTFTGGLYGVCGGNVGVTRLGVGGAVGGWVGLGGGGGAGVTTLQHFSVPWLQ